MGASNTTGVLVESSVPAVSLGVVVMAHVVADMPQTLPR